MNKHLLKILKIIKITTLFLLKSFIGFIASLVILYLIYLTIVQVDNLIFRPIREKEEELKLEEKYKTITWQTYKNDIFRIEFEYPDKYIEYIDPSFFTNETEISVSDTVKKHGYITLKSSYNNIYSGDLLDINIYIYDNNEISSIKHIKQLDCYDPRYFECSDMFDLNQNFKDYERLSYKMERDMSTPKEKLTWTINKMIIRRKLNDKVLYYVIQPSYGGKLTDRIFDSINFF